MPRLDNLEIGSVGLRPLVQSGQAVGAVAHAQSQLAIAMSDLGVTMLMQNRRDDAIRLLKQAVDLAPQERVVFHNLVSTLAGGGVLRGRELLAIKALLNDLVRQVQWADDYRPLFFLPQFLNLEFVSGKCNLHCRMCVGVQSADYPRKFDSMPVEFFEQILLAAPSINGITLSSGNSDPLLHPQLEQIVRISHKHNVQLDIYTNGHPLTEAKSKLFVETGIVKMINVSLDASTPETYRRIRGADLTKVLKNIERLQQIKTDAGKTFPLLSVSMVGMADNIHELPAFVELAGTLSAKRVNVEGLIGWNDKPNQLPSENRPASEHPDCASFLSQATAAARQLRIELVLPEDLRPLVAPSATESRTAGLADVTPDAAPAVAKGEKFTSCSWLQGLYVNRDASISPCCMVHNVADMGSVLDGPLHHNVKYNRVKELLALGKIFPTCADRPCQYVEQQKSVGMPFDFITAADLGELSPAPNPAVQLTIYGRPVPAAT